MFSVANTDRIGALRQAVARLESSQASGAQTYLPLGIPEIDCRLPGGGLACGALHEAAAAAHGDTPAVFGFAVALAALALKARRGPVMLIGAHRCFKDFGSPYGHGLHFLGLDVGRLIIVETRSDKDALWAMEESLRAPTALAMVVGAIGTDIALTMSRRLTLAAAQSGTPSVLLRGHAATGTSAAATRWRIAAEPGAKDRFGALAFRRWSIALERCRHGRTGRWLLEWNHVAHRFHLAPELADRPPLAGAGEELRRAG
jgi:protein ImuA